jgi:hypothetical protein
LLHFRLTDISSLVDHKDLVGQVDLPQMHVVKHLPGAFGPYLIVAGVTE